MRVARLDPRARLPTRAYEHDAGFDLYALERRRLAPGGRVPSLAATLPEQVVTIGSLSKSHSMPGWRAGWMVGPKPLMTHVESLAICMLYGLPGFNQEAALTGVADGL